MKTTIDNAGRVVIPKSLRNQLKLAGGTLLEVRVREGRLELEPAATPMRLVRRRGALVATTENPLPPLSADEVRRIVESQRR